MYAFIKAFDLLRGYDDFFETDSFTFVHVAPVPLRHVWEVRVRALEFDNRG